MGSRTALLPRDPQVKPPATRDLVYLAPSPDFCRLDPDNGIPGTAGRRCNGKSAQIRFHMAFYHTVMVSNCASMSQEPRGWLQTDVSCYAVAQAFEQAGLRWFSDVPVSSRGAAQCAASSVRTRCSYTPAGNETHLEKPHNHTRKASSNARPKCEQPKF